MLMGGGKRMEEHAYLIGEVAAELGINPKTIRYYESLGLLPPPKRTASRYRLYETPDLDRLRFIQRAKAVGLTLQQIARIVKIREGGTPPCDHVKRMLEQRITEIEEQMRSLRGMKRELERCAEMMRTMPIGTGVVCGHIEHLPAMPSKAKR